MAMPSLLGLMGEDFCREKPIKSYHSGRHQLLGNQELHYFSSHHTCRHQITLPQTLVATRAGTHCWSEAVPMGQEDKWCQEGTEH